MNSVSNILFKFANSFDLKDWDGLENTLMDDVECDYQDLRGKKNTYTKIEFVNLRKETLGHLKTQHLFSNLEIRSEEKSAYCRLSAIIYRQDKDGKKFDSHVIYNFELCKSSNSEWKIQKIKQIVLWNEGDSTIHKGVR
ncbi:Scytalone dehydratase [Legionella massiliensis]|uniref:Scytalone dehydratase n=1 Tax=Legionella massiliensis TaxID=1034943 RepID=A0A078KWK4_9GAMM|nr:nuclear transport factor 2 family protein [Legionella massiliensis]CDZ77372.1 Scytalone dehydratase [Legionella massiliensis]CEE13110.1 Scytalone dehydratase [Legionella massiliensis]